MALYAYTSLSILGLPALHTNFMLVQATQCVYNVWIMEIQRRKTDILALIQTLILFLFLAYQSFLLFSNGTSMLSFCLDLIYITYGLCKLPTITSHLEIKKTFVY